MRSSGRQVDVRNPHGFYCTKTAPIVPLTPAPPPPSLPPPNFRGFTVTEPLLVLPSFFSACFPSRLCDYMYELSSQFNRFYENCPVNSAETEDLKRSRTALCSGTADVIQLGLGLLGIGTLDRL